ncbi:MAG: ribosome silencing factor [Spirochaetaceae bacterium]|jgi:ribosome-associated protein|nr:ribosome silencing factor [Spirochaetaceae bacterium]
MADMLSTSDSGLALELGELLAGHRAGDVAVMDMRALNMWTDFFIVATVTSAVHMQGLRRHIGEFCAARGVEILHRRRKIQGDDEWNLMDMGTTVVHLMTAKARSFYELERLWSEAPVIYSSKSS